MSTAEDLSWAEAHAEVLAEMPDEELAALRYDWRAWARPEQRRPTARTWTIWLILAGRGWGKTRTGAETVREWVEEARRTGAEMRIALVGATVGDVREVMLDGESGLLNIFPPHERPRYIQSRAKVTFPGSCVVAYIYSAEKPRRLRGPQHHKAWCDELAAWQHLDETWSNLMMGLRLGTEPQVIITTTPRPLTQLASWVAESANDGGSVVLTRGTTWRNAANLPDKFFAEVIAAYVGTRLGEQELKGELLGQLEGALFRREWIRRSSVPAERFTRIVVALDPATTTRNNETGIVVVGRLGDRGYVLEDISGKWTPQEWATKARDAAARWRPLCQKSGLTIVAETNAGGDMVETALRQFDKGTPFKAVRAWHKTGGGKETRAEPIAALYEQGRIFHCGTFEALEMQMCTFDPRHEDELRAAGRGSAKSPDRLDALVWGLKELGFHIGVARFAPVAAALPTTT